MKFLNSNLILLSSIGLVVNNAFNYTLTNDPYFIYNTSITKFGNDIWMKIIDQNNFEKPFLISNSENVNYVVSAKKF